MMPYLINMRIVLIFFVTFSTTIIVEDFENSYLAEPGDVFSADMFNEQHSNIKNTLKTWSSLDLVGKWSCNTYSNSNSNIPNMTGNYEGLYKSAGHVYVFKNDGDGTFSVSSGDNKNGLLTWTVNQSDPRDSTHFVLVGDMILFGELSRDLMASFKPKSKTRFFIVSFNNPNSFIYNFALEICDKTHQSSNPNNNSDSETWQSLAPNKHPTGLSINLIGTTVSLNWTDNASNETGYKIYRKSTRKGSFSLIHTTAANISSYQDSISSSSTATYWYKIVPVNATGDGKPSKALKVRYTAQ